MNPAMRRAELWVALSTVGVALLLTGCRRQGRSDPERERLVVTRLEEVQLQLQAGETNRALQRLTEMLTRRELRPWWAPVLQRTLQVFLASDRVGEAQRLFLQYAEEGEEIVGPSFSLISQHLEARNDVHELARWHEQLAGRTWSSPRAAMVWFWHLETQRRLGEHDRVVALLPDALRSLSASESQRVLENFFDRCLDQKNYDLAQRLVQWVESRPEMGAEGPRLAAMWRVQMLLSQEQWSEAAHQFRQEVPRLRDADVAELLRRIGRAAGQSGAWGPLDDLFRYAALDLQLGETSAEWAARYWLGSAEKRGDADEAVDRLSRLVDRGYPPPALARLCSQVFYSGMKRATAENQKRLVKMAGQIRDALVRQEHKSQARDMEALLLDGAVLQHEYATALALLEKGVGPSDPAWRKMAETKLRAHLALENGQREDAIRLFRGFMDCVRDHREPTVDPTTGLRHTPEMTLGLNAKRIGDIYASMGRPEEAHQAYEEAVTYYRTALFALGEETPEGRWISERLSEMDRAQARPRNDGPDLGNQL